MMFVVLPPLPPMFMDYGGLVWKWVPIGIFAGLGYWYSETDKFMFGLSVVGGGLVLDVYEIGKVEDKDRVLRVEWDVLTEAAA